MVTNIRTIDHFPNLDKASLDFADLFGLSKMAVKPAYVMITSPHADLFFSIVHARRNDRSTPAEVRFHPLVVKNIILPAHAMVENGPSFDRISQPLQPGSSRTISSYRTLRGDLIQQWERFDLHPAEYIAQFPANITLDTMNGDDPDDDEDDFDEDDDLVEEDGSDGDEPDDDDDLEEEDKNGEPAVEVDENDDDPGSDEEFDEEEVIPEPEIDEEDDNDDEDDDDEDEYGSDWDEDDDDDEDDFSDDGDLRRLNS